MSVMNENYQWLVRVVSISPCNMASISGSLASQLIFGNMILIQRVMGYNVDEFA